MRKTLYLIPALSLCILLVKYAQAESGYDPNNVEEKVVTIELTKLDVNDTNLELRYKIKNGTNHDVWICGGVGLIAKPFEVFLAEDARTLVIRKRLDVPTHLIWRSGPPSGMYVRLSPGEERLESLSLNLPVQPNFVFVGPGRTQVTQNARFLSLEIGFYDEDLPALVRSILAEAEKFNSTIYDANMDILKDYFKGLLVRGSLGGLDTFETINKDYLNKGQVVINYSYQALTGEKVLRITVDGVSIPYEGPVQQLTSNAGNNIKAVQSQKMINTKPEKPSREKT